jgi:WD40 repeat protein
VAFSSEASVVASGDHDGVVCLTQKDGTLLRVLQGHTDAVYGVRFAEERGMVLSCGADWSVKFWSLRGSCLRSAGFHEGRVLSMALTPTQDVIITTGDDFTLRLTPFEWDETGGRRAATIFDRSGGAGSGSYDASTRGARSVRSGDTSSAGGGDTASVRSGDSSSSPRASSRGASTRKPTAETSSKFSQ